jgi:hypothetical protein
MKRHVLVALSFLVFISFDLSAQESGKSGAGLGIEAGVGYNSMKYTLNSLLGGDSAATLNTLWLQPCIRLHYDILLMPLGAKSNLKLKPFLGYYTFGGKHPVDNNENNIIIAFSSIEAGTGLTFDINNVIQITPAIKAQYIISAKERHITPNQNGSTDDLKANFRNIAANAGIQVRYKYKHFTIGLEAWMGLNNFNKQKGKTAKENNYRFLIGYEL